MFTSIISNTKWCHSVGLTCNFIRTCLFCFCWQMLLPLLFTKFGCCLLPFLLPRFGRCYCHLIVVDLETTCLVVLWADVIALTICDRCCVILGIVCDWCFVTWCLWLMLLSQCCFSFGRCYAMWCDTTFCCKRALNMPMADAIAICFLGWCYCLLF